MQFIDFPDLSAGQLKKAAEILRVVIQGPSYKAPGEAEETVASFLGDPERFAFAAAEDNVVVGWIGGVRGYSHALELHPLAVDPGRQGQGIGRSLVVELEARARAEGYLTLHLGADDEFGGTSLFGQALLPGALASLGAVGPTAVGHPVFFYQRLGYEIVGVLPDANGAGMPDILMAKALS